MSGHREPEVILSKAVDIARRSYLQLVANGDLPPDTELARSNHYRRLLNAGREIRSLGTREAFQHTLNHLFAGDPDLSRRAARDLAHLWAGMIDWPDPERPVLLN